VWDNFAWATIAAEAGDLLRTLPDAEASNLDRPLPSTHCISGVHPDDVLNTREGPGIRFDVVG